MDEPSWNPSRSLPRNISAKASFLVWFLHLTIIQSFVPSVPPSETRRSRGQQPFNQLRMSTSVGDDASFVSLAGPYLIRGSRQKDGGATWSLYTIDEMVDSIDPSYQLSEGARAWAILHSDGNLESPPACVVEAEMKPKEHRLTIATSCSEVLQANLQDVLIRIMAQWCLEGIDETSTSTWTLQVDQEGPVCFDSKNSMQQLFSLESGPNNAEEVVNMVDRRGRTLGRIPRKLVHVHNLLHRGMGTFVTDGTPLQNHARQQQTAPQVYVHRRTDTKRVFPSLYDMFVGGVSLAGEDSFDTAKRELAEELGLTRLEAWSSETPLLTCVVCTAYNRCVVDLYCYCADKATEKIVWQPEEVAWGEFVPYSIVVASAARSMGRLADSQEWPGKYPPPKLPNDWSPSEMDWSYHEWTLWDYVPDGLLVWEAWLRHAE